jgi:hypothetical protein
MGISGQRNAPAALYPGERARGSYWLGGRVALRTGLDTEASLQPGSNPVRQGTSNGCSNKQFVWEGLDSFREATDRADIRMATQRWQHDLFGWETGQTE